MERKLVLELCKAYGLDPENASSEDTIAQRDVLLGAIGRLEQAVQTSGLARHLPERITDALAEATTLAALVEAIVGGEAEDTTG